MKIGIVSDCHGRTKRLRAALDLLAQRGVEAVVHCGDVMSVQCVEMLGLCGVPAYMVIGNMDRHPERLKDAAERSGVNFAWEVIEVPIGDEQFLVATHGHDEEVLDALLIGRQFPYVCHGHTHRPRNERAGAVRVINPGALCHPQGSSRPTFAVLDTDSDTVEVVQVR